MEPMRHHRIGRRACQPPSIDRLFSALVAYVHGRAGGCSPGRRRGRAKPKRMPAFRGRSPTAALARAGLYIPLSSRQKPAMARLCLSPPSTPVQHSADSCRTHDHSPFHPPLPLKFCDRPLLSPLQYEIAEGASRQAIAANFLCFTRTRVHAYVYVYDSLFFFFFFSV